MIVAFNSYGLSLVPLTNRVCQKIKGKIHHFCSFLVGCLLSLCSLSPHLFFFIVSFKIIRPWNYCPHWMSCHLPGSPFLPLRLYSTNMLVRISDAFSSSMLVVSCQWPVSWGISLIASLSFER